MPASLHIGDGFARIGGVTLPARASARGLELGGDAALHPVPFGLRSRLVAWSGDGLPEALLAEMLEGQADGLDPLALQALALHLAGADSGAPGFAASAALVARLLGWPLADINAAEALEIDRLAASLAPAMEQVDDGGWTSVLFNGAENSSDDDEPLEILCARLTTDLQRRAAEGISSTEAAVLSSVTPAAPMTAAAPNVWHDGGRGFTHGQYTAGNAGQAVLGQMRETGATIDPPPDPWRDQGASAGKVPAFPPGLTASAQAGQFSQPLSERGPDAAVWALPEVDGDPALAYQTGPEALTAGQKQQDAPANMPPTGAATGELLPQAPPVRVSDAALTPQAATLQASGAVFAQPSSRQNRLGSGAFAVATTPTRSDLFWQAVAPSGAGQALGGQAAPIFAAAPIAPSNLPMTQATPEPALDLDGIADALHAIADLRGVAR